MRLMRIRIQSRSISKFFWILRGHVLFAVCKNIVKKNSEISVLRKLWEKELWYLSEFIKTMHRKVLLQNEQLIYIHIWSISTPQWTNKLSKTDLTIFSWSSIQEPCLSHKQLNPKNLTFRYEPKLTKSCFIIAIPFSRRLVSYLFLMVHCGPLDLLFLFCILGFQYELARTVAKCKLH